MAFLPKAAPMMSDLWPSGHTIEDAMQEWAKDFYKSVAWQNCRAAYIKRMGGLCERCLRRGLIVPGVIVHHIVHLTPDNITDESVTLCYDNLELVCRDCHADEHSRLKKRYKFDEVGRVIAK